MNDQQDTKVAASAKTQCDRFSILCTPATNFLALLLLFLCSKSVIAADPSTEKSKVRGYIVLVEKDSVVVSVRGFHSEFVVAPDAKITRNGERVRLRRLHPRDHVRLTLETSRNGRTATKIVARAPQ